MTRQKLSLDPPQEDLALVTEALVDEVVQQSQLTARGRMIAPLHRSHSDAVHRMLNAIQPGSYVRPHRHLDPAKPEAWIVLRGRLLFVHFHDNGAIDQHIVLGAQSDQSVWILCLGATIRLSLLSRTLSSSRSKPVPISQLLIRLSRLGRRRKEPKRLRAFWQIF